MTTFKIVFTFDVFFSAEITCTADVLHSYLVFSIGTRFVDPLFLFFFYFITFVGRFHYSTLFIMKTSNKSDEIKKKKKKEKKKKGGIHKSGTYAKSMVQQVGSLFLVLTSLKATLNIFDRSHVEVLFTFQK